MKKYCECFKQGFHCNSLCRCLDCKNKIYNQLNDELNKEKEKSKDIQDKYDQLNNELNKEKEKKLLIQIKKMLKK